MPLIRSIPGSGTFFCPHCGVMYSVTHSRLPRRDGGAANAWSASYSWTSGNQPRLPSISSFIGLKMPDRPRKRPAILAKLLD
jgi:hypothetical protein